MGLPIDRRKKHVSFFFIILNNLPIQGELKNDALRRKNPLLHIQDDAPLSFV
jgi:hypothetical protein